jgi:hypothetical protein
MYATQASYCPVDGPMGQSAETVALSTQIEQVQSALAQPDAQLVSMFYARCGYALAWISNGEISPVAFTAIELLRNVAARGLNPADYSLPAIPSTVSCDRPPCQNSSAGKLV